MLQSGGEESLTVTGLGHSMGGTVMINLALLHPRLFTTVIAIEPTLNRTATEMNFRGAYGPTFRKDQWSSQEEANKFFEANAFYKNWDKRSFDLWLQHGLCSAHKEGQAVMLKTSKHQEALTFARPSYPSQKHPLHDFQPTSQRHPDLGSDREASNAFYRPETTITYAALPLLGPSCLYMYGSRSQMVSAHEKGRADKLNITGTGTGGNGGATQSRVADRILKGSHFVPLEKPAAITEEAGHWMGVQLSTLR